MKDYFLLQYNMVNRQLHAAGVNPALGYIVSIGGSVFLFDLAFQKTEFAKYLKGHKGPVVERLQRNLRTGLKKPYKG